MANVTEEDRRTEGYLNMRRGWFLYLQDIEPERPRLFRYCRKLTGNVWDAEDLVQDTMLKGFGLLAHHDNGVLQWGPYLARIASNLWIDQKRKSQPLSLDDVAEPTTPATAETAAAIREGGRALMTYLSPQERCAIVMKEVFEYTIKEIANLLETTEGAIKAALHSGREKLNEPLVLLFRHFGDGDEKLEEIWRFKEEQWHIAHIWDYCACPETLTEVATDLGIPHTTRPYSYYNNELMQGSDHSA